MNKPIAFSVARMCVLGVAVAVTGFATAGVAIAADKYPTNTVKIVVPFQAGGPNDYVARPIARALSEILDETFIIENKAGADGIIGTATVARAAPDGYTMLITTGSLTANAVLGKSMPYDPLKDFKPVTQIAESYGFTLVTGPAFPANNLDELIAHIRKNPGKITYATSGVGNATHVAGKLFEKAVGVSMQDVPYKGGGAGLNDVMSGVVDLTFISASVAGPQIEAGKLKIFASTGHERIPTLPNVPTLKERGFDNVVVNGFYGLWFPAGVPDEIVETVQKATVKALAVPGVRTLLDRAGLKSIGSTPQDFAAFIDRDYKWQQNAMALIGLNLKK